MPGRPVARMQYLWALTLMFAIALVCCGVGLEQSSLPALMLHQFLHHSGLQRDKVALEYLKPTEHKNAAHGH